MATYTQDELLDKYEDLPDNLKEALFSVDNAKVMQDVGKQNSLTVAQVGTLAQEAGYIMMGISPTKDFIPRLSENLGIDKERARKIAHEVNDKIFSKVRESLKEVHGMTPSSPRPGSEQAAKEMPKREEELGQIPKIIEPQKVLKDDEETTLKDLASETGGVAPIQESIPSQITQTTDKATETTEGRDIFAEKMSEESHRMPIETTEKEHEPFLESVKAGKKSPPSPENTEDKTKEKTESKPKYKESDPYREPIA